MVLSNEVSEMVIGSGVAYNIRIWIEYCFNKMGLKVIISLTSQFLQYIVLRFEFFSSPQVSHYQ